MLDFKRFVFVVVEKICVFDVRGFFFKLDSDSSKKRRTQFIKKNFE